MLGALAFFAASHSAFVAAAPPCQADPGVVKLADPALPAGYRNHLSGTRIAVVAVTLDAAGHVTGASIYTSSGDTVLDNAAVDAAKRSLYAPGQTNCKPSGGTFAVQVSFEGTVTQGNDVCPREATAVSLVAPDASMLRGTTAGQIQVRVGVTIDPDGKLTTARILQSSGNMALDRAALAAARESTYRPKLIAVPVRRQAGKDQTSSSDGVTCKAVPGTYTFIVTIDPRS
jgi:TonB family protein